MAEPKKMGCAQAIFTLAFLGVGLWFYFGGGLEQVGASSMAKIEAKVAADQVETYNIAKRNGSPIDICVQAQMVAAGFLQAKDEPNYATWKKVSDADCAAAGLPSQEPAPAHAAMGPAIEIDAAALMAAYKNNEVSADMKYKGKLVKVTGKVGDIKKDFTNQVYVTVGTGAMFEIPEVQAFFGDADTAKAASLNKGQRISIVGRCDGLMMNVILKDSKFVE